MWKPPANFITLHYAYILTYGILAMAILYPAGNLSAIDAYFFGVSGSTESGLNPVDVKALFTYQQVFLYIVPIVTNLGFINVIVVVVRLRWFQQRFKGLAKSPKAIKEDQEHQIQTANSRGAEHNESGDRTDTAQGPNSSDKKRIEVLSESHNNAAPHIKFAPTPERSDNSKETLHIPTPLERENGQPITPLSNTEKDDHDDEDAIEEAPKHAAGPSSAYRRRKSDTRSLSKATSIDRAVSSIFVLGSTTSRRSLSEDRSRVSEPIDLALLSREELGGIEYHALRVLLKVTIGYYVGLHVFGVLCLLPWIHTADAKYKDYLASQGQDKTWWAFYSAQTMVCNLGFTLTPDSMISFRDATWPMLVMSFLAFAGNTFYPIFLRLLIWTLYKLSPASSSLKESLRFLLDHPRRCYTLLFPSVATWTLAAVLFALNFIDVLLIICLDLDNPEVNVLSVGPRILAAIFQAASARHTGTATFNLANVNPAVQFSLLVMMYISIYPIAISIRMSSSYEEQPLGLYESELSLDERRGSKSYMIGLMRNQLSFDLWYIFLGAFSVFSVFFEVTSAYANVGLSLGHPSNMTSLCGHFTVFSKLVICVTMIRGRHRGLPYALDRAITLPSDRLADDEDNREGRYKDREGGDQGGLDKANEKWSLSKQGRKMMKAYTR